MLDQLVETEARPRGRSHMRRTPGVLLALAVLFVVGGLAAYLLFLNQTVSSSAAAGHELGGKVARQEAVRGIPVALKKCLGLVLHRLADEGAPVPALDTSTAPAPRSGRARPAGRARGRASGRRCRCTR